MAAQKPASLKKLISGVIRCPDCGFRSTWKLADGRRKCERCRKLHHGGFKKNFKLFIREMEFRLNHRKDEDAAKTLY